MARSVQIGSRISPEVMEALKRAAETDDRSIASMLDRILREWLTEHGHMAAAAAKTARKRGKAK